MDEKGKLKVISGVDAYRIIINSYYKTEIARDLQKEGENEKKEDLEDGEDPYFYSDIEYVEEDDSH